MPDDKLTRAERIRLEALAQAVAYLAITHNSGTISNALDCAEVIETWLYEAKEPR